MMDLQVRSSRREMRVEGLWLSMRCCCNTSFHGLGACAKEAALKARPRRGMLTLSQSLTSN